ncbi:hypothetical protein V9L05_11560 [Bernardetia sp. Wsw4-3y2]|uniref:hypothetical protein n=1 Tax=unclassified Bernardetia TaxID=2647129 RepID=UPI0030D2CAA2
MKNLSFLLIAFCILCFSSCKKDEELSTKDKIVGEWQYESLKYEVYINEELVDSGLDSLVGSTIEFKSNETLISSFIDENGDVQTDNDIWVLLEEENKIIIGDIGDRDILEIQELTESTMILIQNIEVTGSGSGNDFYRRRDEVSLTKK